ncbi:MAG: DUF4129 domain-containing protein [Salinimicrobium sp.]
MRVFLFLISFLCAGFITSAAPEGFPLQVAAQEEVSAPVPLKFDKEKISSYKEDPAFDYTEKIKQDNWWSRFKRWVGLQWSKFLQWLFGDFEAPPLLILFLKILPYLLLALLLGLVVYLFSRFNAAAYFSSPQEKPKLILDEDEKIIRKRDIKVLIESAISRGNFRLAVRYHFLYMLQQLTQRDLISYDSSKTDEDYLEELLQPELKNQFQKLNRIYDFVWYGHFDTGREDFEKIRKDFQKMQFLISPSYEQNL